ncbi:MAG: K+ transport system, NAD-binding component [halophilic archaeon J07HB67]|nr:MAG: K+ transport system, NAD-binding component [halophilic archaeon J07HB67]
MTQTQPPDAGRTGEPSHVVLGDARSGVIARRLRADGHTTAVVSETDEREGGVTDPTTLADAGVGGAATVVVATRSDSRNLLVAQLVRANFDVTRLLVLVNDPDHTAALADAGHEPVCVTSAVSESVVREA